MIDVHQFCEALQLSEINFFAGVPDSLLKSFCAYISDNAPSERNIIAANEGNALAIAAGYHLSTGKTPLVYMQNSGLGNIVNPLLSLNAQEVYSIPALLVIGWRGEPGEKDEPQHKKQGAVTLELLKALDVPFFILDSQQEEKQWRENLSSALKIIKDTNKCVALVVKKNTFGEYHLRSKEEDKFSLSREQALITVLQALNKDDALISTTGMLSRELYEIREKNKSGHQRDFLTVGSMGHASQIALGIALAKPDKRIVCLDGDGALLMHMGGMAIVGQKKPSNYLHVLFNNGAHDSVGGQKTVGLKIDIPKIACACGYRSTYQALTEKEIFDCLSNVNGKELGPILLEIKVNKGARKDLGRPITTPEQNKISFMNFLGVKNG